MRAIQWGQSARLEEGEDATMLVVIHNQAT